MSGITKDAASKTLGESTVTAHNVDKNTDLLTVSKADGSNEFSHLEAGQYEMKAAKDTLTSGVAAKVLVGAGQVRELNFTLTEQAANNAVNTQPQGFWERFTRAYADD